MLIKINYLICIINYQYYGDVIYFIDKWSLILNLILKSCLFKEIDECHIYKISLNN